MSLTLAQIALYAGALFILFVTPGPVWLALTARTLGHGIRGAIPLMLGVAIGDMVWSLLAILGLAWIVGSYAWVMDLLRWLAVLVFAAMGLLLIYHADKRIDTDSRLNRPGQWAGFAAGLAAILANPKAVLFYMGMLPGFFDLTAITAPDILAIAVISVIVPLLCNFAFAAFVDRARLLIASPGALKRTNQVAGVLLMTVAVAIALTNP
ncbi:LysE family translocator [Rhodophyticola sp. CCM32]|uniref:LysE family translocator n=1 Tax=Rhodophyticola sp. CCM32 TaxID=2916397 RepID=UPI00107F274D|nr:LysE family translocator [Rhodophyticola sp. CCM32]QBY01909.1 LysE family translocator [Rhodophyticola sp. CCM32]